MSGTRRARTALTRALTVSCVVLLCVFGAGPAAATAAESRPPSASGASAPAPAPGDPVEGQSEPAADPEVRVGVRTVTRGMPDGRRPVPVMFHVKQPDEPESGTVSWRTVEPVLSSRAVRSVVLRC